MQFKNLFIGAFVGLFIINSVCAQDLSLDTAVRMGELPNGFRYFIKANTYPKNRAVLYLANKVGSILEEEKESGLAHFLEHMNFKGTTHFPKNELINYLEGAGVKFGADLNAYTSFDETVYQLPIPTDQPDLWKNGLQIMRDWASEAILDEQEFEKERGVILEEKRLQQNASGRMREKYLPALYNFSRYAERAPIGLEEVIAKADITRIRDFYKRWYRPDLQALIVVGDIDVAQVEQQIKALFGDLKMPAKAPDRPQYSIDLIDSLRYVQVKDKEFSSYQLEFFYKRKAAPVKDVAGFKGQLVRQLSNSLLASRFQEIARAGEPSYRGMSVSAGDFIDDITTLNVRVALRPDKLDAGFKAAWTELLRIQRHGFTADEFQDVKERLRTQLSLQLSEKDKIPSINFVEDYLQYFLQGTAFQAVEQEIALTTQLLDQITTQDIRQYLNDFLAAKDVVALVLGADDGIVLPSKQDLLTWQAEAAAMEIRPYVQQRDSLALFREKPIAGTVKKVQQHAAIGFTQWTLRNGVNIYAKATDFKNNEILFTGFSRGGASLYADADYYSAVNASTFVLNSGVGQLNANQLAQFLNAKAVQVRPYIADREEGISGASSAAALETALGLTHQYMASARLDTARFHIIMDRSKEAMRNRDADPKQVFADTVGNVLGGYHFRRQPTSVQTLAQIQADRVSHIFQERFANAGDFNFVFVGNFNLDSLKALTELYLGSLPATSTREEAIDLNIRVPEGKIRKDLTLGAGDKGTVQLVYSGKYRYSMQNNIYLDALKTAVELRLMERLRKRESGVYSPSVQLTKAKHPLGFFAVVISFDCDPKREDELITAVREELAKIVQEGIVGEELSKFVAEEKRTVELQSTSNQFWLSYLKGQLEKQEPLSAWLSYPTLLDKTSVTALNKYVKKLPLLENEIIVTLTPANK